MSLVAEVLGMIAGTLTTIAFVPQVLRIYRTKSARDVSYLTFGMFSVGVALWLIYGVMIDSAAIIAANVVTLVLATTVLVLKARYHR
jgi:MtN3 and saliva related transmembrane protein